MNKNKIIIFSVLYHNTYFIILIAYLVSLSLLPTPPPNIFIFFILLLFCYLSAFFYFTVSLTFFTPFLFKLLSFKNILLSLFSLFFLLTCFHSLSHFPFWLYFSFDACPFFSSKDIIHSFHLHLFSSSSHLLLSSLSLSLFSTRHLIPASIPTSFFSQNLFLIC